MDTVEEGEGRTNWESSTEIYILPCVKQIANRKFCDNLEGWDGVGDGKEVQEGGDICIPVADSCLCMAETDTTF